jgi:hypothetical protein
MSNDDDVVVSRSGIDIIKISQQIIGDVPRISEQLFISRILPLFTAKDVESLDLGLWMEFAGSMQTPLDVVGPGGEILFRAPSPLRSVIQLNRRTDDGNPSLIQIVDTAKRKADVHPGIGENYLDSQLMQLDIIRDIDKVETENAWKTIFERYNIASKTNTDKPTTTSAAVNKPLIFEDEDDPL